MVGRDPQKRHRRTHRNGPASVRDLGAVKGVAEQAVGDFAQPDLLVETDHGALPLAAQGECRAHGTILEIGSSMMTVVHTVSTALGAVKGIPITKK